MENNSNKIPTPDISGAEHTQVAEQFSPQPDSPMSMGNVACGLAAESNSGLNRQAAMLVTADYVNLRNRLEKKEHRLEEVLPELAVLAAENKNLKKQKKVGAFINLIGTISISLGTAILAGIFSASVTQDVQVAGWILVAIGVLLHGVTMFASWSGD